MLHIYMILHDSRNVYQLCVSECAAKSVSRRTRVRLRERPAILLRVQFEGLRGGPMWPAVECYRKRTIRLQMHISSQCMLLRLRHFLCLCTQALDELQSSYASFAFHSILQFFSSYTIFSCHFPIVIFFVCPHRQTYWKRAIGGAI